MLNLHECYEVLGVSPNASAQEIRRAYLEQVKRWHPDSHVQFHRSKAQAQDRFFKVQAAYDQLKQRQPGSQTRPINTPINNSPKQTQRVSQLLTAAEQLYDNAVQLARQGQYQKAIAQLSTAIRIDPKYALAYKYRGHLKAYLGLDHESKVDLVKAQVVERNNTAVQSQVPTELDCACVDGANLEQSSGFSFNTLSRYGFPLVRKVLRLDAGLLLFIAVGILLHVGIEPLHFEQDPYPVSPQPIDLESVSAEH